MISLGPAWLPARPLLRPPPTRVWSRLLKAPWNHWQRTFRALSSGRSYTEAEDTLIIQRRREGKTCKAIAQELDRTPWAVKASYYRRLFKDNVRDELRSTGHRYSSADDDFILHQRALGKTLPQIAADLGLSQKSVAQRYYDGKSKVKNTPTRRGVFSKEELTKIADLKHQGQFTWRQIAARVGRSRDATEYAYRKVHGKQHTKIRYTDVEKRELVHLRDVEGLTWTQIANTLQQKYMTVYCRYQHLKQLQRIGDRTPPYK